MGWASLYGGLAIAGVWAICRLLPRLSPTVRSWLWRIVYVELILVLSGLSPIRIPLLPKPDMRIEAVETASDARPMEPASGVRRDRAPTVAAGPSTAWAVPDAPRAWGAMFLAWLGGVGWLAGRNLRAWRDTRRTRCESRPLDDPWLQQECESLSRYLRLRCSPQLLCHENASGPQAIGPAHPALLFPVAFARQRPPTEVRLVMAHELAHLRRHDLFWEWLRRVVNGVLFFHPLVWVARRQALLADEMACDALALRVVNATVTDYAGTLLRIAEDGLLVPRSSPALLGTGMSSAHWMMDRRLRALPHSHDRCSNQERRRRWRATLLGGVAAALVLTVGLMTWFHDSGIRQIDPRYPVLGFTVSRGRNHVLSVDREVLRFAGLSVSRRAAQMQTPSSASTRPGGVGITWSANTTLPSKSMPSRLAGWMRKVGLKPTLSSDNYSSGIYLGEESCVIAVRFGCDARNRDCKDIAAFLVDEQGEAIRLVPHSDGSPTSSEYLKFWVITPAPITRAKFNLLLRKEADGKDVAEIRLGEL